MSLQQDFANASEELATKRAGLADLYKQADTITDPTKRDELAGSIKSANAELDEKADAALKLQDMLEGQRRNAEALKAMRAPVGRQILPQNEEATDEAIDEIGAKSVKSLLSEALKGNGLKSFSGFRGSLGELAVKTLISSGSLAPQAERLAPQASAQEDRTVGDLMLQGTTDRQAIEYYYESTFTNAAVEVAEGLVKPEAALDFTLRTDSVRKIATWVPVTDEMLADVPAFESYVRERLGFMVKRREEAELLLGDGTAPNIQGIENRAGVQTITGYGSSTIDALYHGITLIRSVAFAEPTAVVMHPNDWENVRLSKDANQNYLLGPATSEGPARVWGLEVRITTAQTENTALVGAFRPHAQIFRRSGIEIAISTENEDYFLKNKVAVRAEERLALAVYRPAAFCKVEAIVLGS